MNNRLKRLSFSKLIIMFGCLCFLIVILFIIKHGPSTGAEIHVPFNYTVKSISTDYIVLSGESGDMTLSNNPSSVSVYDASHTLITIAELTVNAVVKLDFVPGVNATIYLQN